ncbi:MAG: class C sortase [Oscillospiraceae bacterium]|nr:class C sortase [Oscillospiraceae bacterium]
MKKHLSSILLIVIFLIGLSLLLYPTVSDYWNSLHQSRAIATYAESMAHIDADRYDALWADARSYNAALLQKPNRLMPSAEEQALYSSLLDVSGNGILGYIEIPSIQCSLPIYHGVDPAVLQIAVGHIEGTSLPTGGPSTHAVLSGHRGLPSAKLFTNLDQLVEGDIFMLRVLDETLTYEVDRILIVEPHEVNALEILPGEDLCTLVTCTPYGVNSHRLLVRGHRVDNQEIAKTVHVTADALQIEPVIVAPIVAAPMLLVLFIAMLVTTRKKKTGGM